MIAADLICALMLNDLLLLCRESDSRFCRIPRTCDRSCDRACVAAAAYYVTYIAAAAVAAYDAADSHCAAVNVPNAQSRLDTWVVAVVSLDYSDYLASHKYQVW